MEVEVRIQGTDSAEAIRRYATRRIHFALGRFAPRVGRTVVRISDINGVRGGVDQCCQIRAELLPKGKVVVDQVDADLFSAIDRASERIGHAFRREVQRVRDARTHRESVRTPA
ncbi:MAG: HPF/RaiA family ribosome-associated protein [Acidobacteriia bacterium]|nr:HPF/RaiA family ribosome-associated protein [Terriglobia bacterium]